MKLSIQNVSKSTEFFVQIEAIGYDLIHLNNDASLVGDFLMYYRQHCTKFIQILRLRMEKVKG